MMSPIMHCAPREELIPWQSQSVAYVHGPRPALRCQLPHEREPGSFALYLKDVRLPLSVPGSRILCSTFAPVHPSRILPISL